jgi:hypothetical protein
MSQHIHTSPTKRKWSTKLIAGFTAFAAAAIIGSGSFALAAPGGKPTKEQCKEAGYSNYGQCVKEWSHNKNKPGNGYGGHNHKHCHNLKHGHGHGHGHKKHCHSHKHKHGHGHGHHGHGHGNKHKHGHRD